MNKLIILASLLIWMETVWAEAAKPPVHLAIIGLVHDHAYGFIPLTQNRPDVQLVGIVEPDRELAASYAQKFDLNSNLFCPSLGALLAKTNVNAVSAFTTTLDHRRVVEMCAPLHIDVMMEKPLAVNMEEARAIQAAARSGGIQVIVNSQGIIQASWNWPLDRKDMEIYGTDGYVLAPRKDLLRIRKVDTEECQVELPAPPPSGPPRNQLTYLVSVVRGEIQPSGPSCLEMNLTVTEILDAARESARTGRRIELAPAAAR